MVCYHIIEEGIVYYYFYVKLQKISVHPRE